MTRVAVVQMSSSTNVEDNLNSLESCFLDAARAGAAMVFLPENFAALASPDAEQIAVDESSGRGPIRTFLGNQAKAHGVWIQAGTLPMKSRPDGVEVPDGRLRAASLVYDANGNEVARYDKIHMFDVDVEDNQKVYRESGTYEAGDHLTVVETPLGRMGLTVCYDIRFPELYRRLLHQGAQVFSIPSAFTRVTGEAHWMALARARAIENFAYVIGACQWGSHDSGRETWGESLVVDPWGEILLAKRVGIGVSLVDVDLARVHDCRTRMPVHKQARLSVRLAENTMGLSDS